MQGIYSILLLIVSNICMVRTLEVAGNESHQQLAALCRCSFLVGYCFGGIFMPGAGKQNRFPGKWRTIHTDAA